MSFPEFFASYWWLMFPIFGMVMAFSGMSQMERRNNAMLDLIKSYVDQGKEPPADLVKLAAAGLKENPDSGEGDGAARGWSFVTFAAIAVGFGTAYYFTRTESFSWVFLAVAAAMGVMALGALVLLAINKKS
jgi:hypothetical protein